MLSCHSPSRPKKTKPGRGQQRDLPVAEQPRRGSRGDGDHAEPADHRDRPAEDGWGSGPGRRSTSSSTTRRIALKKYRNSGLVPAAPMASLMLVEPAVQRGRAPAPPSVSVSMPRSDEQHSQRPRRRAATPTTHAAAGAGGRRRPPDRVDGAAHHGDGSSRCRLRPGDDGEDLLVADDAEQLAVGDDLDRAVGARAPRRVASRTTTSGPSSGPSSGSPGCGRAHDPAQGEHVGARARRGRSRARSRRRAPRRARRRVPTWTSSPSRMIRIRSPSLSASDRSWVMNTIVLPTSRCSRMTSVCMSRRISGSSAENGSSKSRTSGSTASARARPTRCCMPPESWSG